VRPLRHSVRVGVSFGLTSGIITTLGLLVGLSKGTSSKAAVVAGVLTIALADSLSDALGIHMSEESEGVHRPSEIWTSTFSTFAAKLVMALTFVIPVALLPLDTATIVAIVWGAVALTTLSISQARGRGVDPVPAVLEHLVAGVLVVVASFLVGTWMSTVF
jgi:VIT1/CCC1 family predicted Fe2+/Mn2+ transporter